MTQVNNIVNYAIANELVDVNKVSYLKDLTGLDIMKSISINHDIKKAEELVTSHNLTVNKNHTFIVSGVIAHNVKAPND